MHMRKKSLYSHKVSSGQCGRIFGWNKSQSGIYVCVCVCVCVCVRIVRKNEEILYHTKTEIICEQ